MNHTKEPWHVCDGLISSEKKEAIALVEHSGMNGPVSPTGSANARRIVACVNACSGIETELLEDPEGRFNPGFYGRMASKEGTRANKAEKDRDELLAALKERTGFYYERNVPHQFSLPHCLCRECTDKRCDSALANIEAKK